MKQKKSKISVLFLAVIALVILLFAFSDYGKGNRATAFSDLIDKYAAYYDLEPELIKAVIKVESNFDQKALSGAGAKGLMQIMDDTETWVASKRGENSKPWALYEAEYNISVGTYYLRYLMDRFGSAEVALAAYNAGPTNVVGWLDDELYSSDGKTLSDIPFPETKAYVSKVMSNYEKYKKEN